MKTSRNQREPKPSTCKIMTIEILREIAKKSGPRIAAQDKRIREILEIEEGERARVSEETLKRYREYLKANLELPCLITGVRDFKWEGYYIFGPGSKKEYEEFKTTQPSYKDHFKILRIFEDRFDGFRGILVRVRRIPDRRQFDLPLVDLEAVDKESSNAQLLEDYSSWFANNR